MIEHEFKFVLKLDRVDELFSLLADSRCSQIEQFYVQGGPRFRSTLSGVFNPDTKLFDQTWSTPNHFFTFKMDVDGRLLEIETKISASDFKLAKKKAISTITKIRYNFYGDGSRTPWEIDIFLDAENNPIFVMVEIETDESVLSQEICPALAPYLELAVPHDRNEYFSNLRLSDPDYLPIAIKRYKEMFE